MTTALPAASVATNSSATEGDVKTWLTNLHDYLAGLLGTDGLPATARTALGLASAFVTSVNGNTGAISAAQVSAAATAGYGYTPQGPAGSVNYATYAAYLSGGSGYQTGAFYTGYTDSVMTNHLNLYHSSGGTCVHPHSLILMADGSQKFAVDIRPGNQVMTEIGADTVIGVWESVLGERPLVSINHGPALTPDHLIKTSSGWAAYDPELYARVDYGKTKAVKTLSGMRSLPAGTVPPSEVHRLSFDDRLIMPDGFSYVTSIDLFDIEQPALPVLSIATENTQSIFVDGYAVAVL